MVAFFTDIIQSIYTAFSIVALCELVYLAWFIIREIIQKKLALNFQNIFSKFNSLLIVYALSMVAMIFVKGIEWQAVSNRNTETLHITQALIGFFCSVAEISYTTYSWFRSSALIKLRSKYYSQMLKYVTFSPLLYATPFIFYFISLLTFETTGIWDTVGKISVGVTGFCTFVSDLFFLIIFIDFVLESRRKQHMQHYENSYHIIAVEGTKASVSLLVAGMFMMTSAMVHSLEIQFVTILFGYLLLDLSFIFLLLMKVRLYYSTVRSEETDKTEKTDKSGDALNRSLKTLNETLNRSLKTINKQ